MPTNRWRSAIDAALVLGATAFLLNYFRPSLLSSPTIPTGGDTAGQYLATWFMRVHLLPHALLSGWCPGNYAGYPIFHYYFPLPFLFASGLSYICSLPVAFKWITALGSFLMPACVYFSFRLLGVGFPGPGLAAVFTLPFLLMEGNSMWGGNIPSTLSGEWAYSLSFTLSLLFLGSLYRGIKESKYLGRNALLMAAIGLSHACGLLFSGLYGFFFLTKAVDFRKNAAYLAKLYGLAFLVLGFWIIPLLVYERYTVPFNFLWIINSWRELLPAIILPYIALTIVYSVWSGVSRQRDERTAYLWYGVALAGLLYLIGHELHIPDIRFVPFAQILLILISCLGVAAWFSKIEGRLSAAWLLIFMTALTTFWWVGRSVHYIPTWVAWNYSGFENKRMWGPFQKINEAVAGTVSDPRVAYENSPIHNHFGTMRALELLPYFSGRSTLEGLYIQDSVSSPFIYLLQAEISDQASDAVPGYYYPATNLRRGVEHLKLFNTQYLILVSENMKQQAKKIPEFLLKATFPPYEIYELTKNDGRYVVPLKFQPVVFTGNNWKEAADIWYRHLDQLDVPLLFGSASSPHDPALAGLPRTANPVDLPRIPYTKPITVRSELKGDEILIETSEIGRPLAVRVSFHPNWHVEGADRVYHAAPSLMVIFPTEHKIRLHFGRNGVDYAGMAATGVGLVGLFLLRKKNRLPLEKFIPKISQRLINATWAVLLLGLIGYGFKMALNRPPRLEKIAMKLFDAKDFEPAKKYFEKNVKQEPRNGIGEYDFYFVTLCDIHLRRTGDEIGNWQRIIREYPDGRHAAEAHFHLSELYTARQRPAESRQEEAVLFRDFPDSYWATVLHERSKGRKP